MKKLFILVVFVLSLGLFIGCNSSIEGITIESEGNVREIAVNETLKLVAKVFPESADQAVLWSSDLESVATVSSEGIVTAVGVGNVNIIAKAKTDESVSQKYTLIVKEAKVVEADPESVEITSQDATVKTGSTLRLTAKVLPDNASQQVVWASSDESIATVSRGEVRGLKEGTVTITVSAKDFPNVTDSIEVVVEKGEAPAPTQNWDDIEYSTHEDYINSENDTLLKVKGVVTYVYPEKDNAVNYIIQNGKDGYYVYAQDIINFPVEVGKSYEIGGFKKYYNGLSEIVKVEYCKELEEELSYEVNKLENVDTSSVEAMKPFQGSLVSGTAVLDSVKVSLEKAYSFYAKVGEYSLQFRVDSSYCTADDLDKINQKLLGSAPGATFNFTGVMAAFGYSASSTKPQIQVIKADMLEFEELSTEKLLEVSAGVLNITETISFNVTTIDLPSVIDGFSGVTVAWTSDNEAINVETGIVTHLASDVTCKLTAKLTCNGQEYIKEFNVLVVASDNTEYEILATLDLEDALDADKNGYSLTKKGYGEGVITLGTPSHNWLLRNALIARISGDKVDGRFSIRAKAADTKDQTGRIEIQEAGEYNVVQFDTAVYGGDDEGIKVAIEYTFDDGATWATAEQVITVNARELETYRVKLPEGSKRVAIVVVENSGNRINFDNIKLMK